MTEELGTADTGTAAHAAVPARRRIRHRAQHGAFGEDAFGRGAEAAARFFGTPQYIVGQTVGVALWIMANAIAVSLRWDPYPFILLNLAFSTQAAYAAPLILLAQTRQAERDKIHAEADAHHREELAQRQLERAADIKQLLELNTELTKKVDRLTAEIYRVTCATPPSTA